MRKVSFITSLSIIFFISCGNERDAKPSTFKSFEDFRAQHKWMHDSIHPKGFTKDTVQNSAKIYLCINNCMKDSIYDVPGRCPVCNAELKAFETIRISKAKE